jgi:serine/threonine protein kinase
LDLLLIFCFFGSDHLAQIIELLGHYPKSLTSVGKYARDYFTSRGELRNIRANLKFWPLDRVLHEKYKLAKEDAQEIADFLVPMLAIRRNKRMTAQQALEHGWIKNIDINDFNSCFVERPRATTEASGGANGTHQSSNNNADEAAMEISTSEKK